MSNEPVIPVATSTAADLLLEACPFLRDHRDEYWECGPTIVFGDVARLLKSHALAEDQVLAVFKFFNVLADSGDDQNISVLATGALESFNDDAASQRLARRYLRGKALSLLEEMRTFWGQPDYGKGDKE